MSRQSDNQPLRILFLANAGAVHAQRWVAYFREQGHQTRWLSLEDIPPGIDAVKLPERFFHKAGSILLAVPRIKAEIRRFRPQVVNALFIPNYGWAGALCGFSPLAVAAWGSDVLISPQKSVLHRRRVSWAIKKADLLFSDAQVITERMVELGAAQNKIVTVPLGVDPVLLDDKRKDRCPGDVCTVVTNRKFEPLYRNDTFVNAAIEQAGQPSSKIRFDLIGDGPERAGLEQKVKDAGLTEMIRFSSFLPVGRLYKLLARADIYVSCSESDGTSVSLLEALALGLYPIVSDIPGNREWINDGINGRLFPVGDAVALARIIQEVFASPEQWPEVAEKNRAIIKERALWRDNMAVVEQAIKSLVGSTSRRG